MRDNLQLRGVCLYVSLYVCECVHGTRVRICVYARVCVSLCAYLCMCTCVGDGAPVLAAVLAPAGFCCQGDPGA